MPSKEAQNYYQKVGLTYIDKDVERLYGCNSFIEEYSRTLDGRVKNFDMIQVDNITNDTEIDKLLEEISNRNR